MAATTSRRERRRQLRRATRRRVRGGEHLAPRPLQALARQVDDAAHVASGRVRRALAGNRPFVVGLVALFVVGALVISGPLTAYLGQRDRVELLEQQLQVLEDANADLDQRRQDLRDPEHVEVLAREELGYVRPGEVPYVVVPPERDASRIAEPLEVAEPEGRSWYQGLLDGLVGLFG